jgi:hypothetical protein
MYARAAEQHESDRHAEDEQQDEYGDGHRC